MSKLYSKPREETEKQNQGKVFIKGNNKKREEGGTRKNWG